MKFASFVFAVLPVLVSADFTLWSGTCDTGLGDGQSFGSDGASTDAQGACNGCTLTGTIGGGDLTAGNPCNPNSCGDDPLDFQWDGSQYNIVVHNTGISVGTCQGTAGDFAACNTATYSCSMTPAFRCVTSYCN